jgi:glycosyltransferase involved in cell wall biosynthesis
MPDFSLILATAGRTTELHRFFASLKEAGCQECECIVVDQNPDDRLLPILAVWADRIAITHLRSSPGLSHARNVGLAAANGIVLAFPDDDCWYSPHLLEEVRSFFADNSRYALLSAGVRDESGRLSGNRWVRDRCDLATANLFRTSVGMALFVRRDRVCGAFEFDESLGVGAGTRFASGEDTDYVFRLLRAGLRGRFDRRLTVYHARRDMLSGGANAARAYSYGCGMGRVIRKQGKLPLLPAFVAFDVMRLGYSLLRGRPEPARLCAVHGRGIFSGFMAAKRERSWN